MTRLIRDGIIAALTLGSALAHSGNWNVPTDAKHLTNPTVATTTTLARAREVYTTHCADCHGPEAAGNGSKSQVEYDLRTIVDPLTDGELYWKITHGVGKMPSFAGVLNDEERWYMVNYLRHLRNATKPVKPLTRPG
jgi:mono/diheme cytochrome c family protein